MKKNNKVMTITGWVLAGVLLPMFAMSAYFKIAQPDWVVKDWTTKAQYPANALLPIGMVEVMCVLIFIFPRTAVLGAILLTGYLGGAVATHVRVSEPWFVPVVFGVVVWTSLYLRDARIRALVPLRSPSP